MVETMSVEQIDAEISALEERIDALRSERWETVKKNTAMFMGFISDREHEDPDYGGCDFIYLGRITEEQAKKTVDDCGYTGYFKVTEEEYDLFYDWKVVQPVVDAANRLANSCNTNIKYDDADVIRRTAEKMLDGIKQQIRQFGFFVGCYDRVLDK